MNLSVIDNPIELTILSVALLLFVVQLCYYLGIYNNIYRRMRSDTCADNKPDYGLPPLSVIISAHDESAYLKENLPYILRQDYPAGFEVIVINDGSTDETDDVLKLFANEYKNLYHSFTPSGSRYLSSKKLALTLGVKAAKYDWLVFTEADCVPQSDEWLSRMASNISPHTDIVLGYCGAGDKSDRFVSFDRLFTAMRYLGFAIAGRPYMGMGRNMAYRKELFYREKGYSQHLNLLRGEDDLFINRTATPLNTKVEVSEEATVRVNSTHKEWLADKMSYLITARELKGNQRYILGAETLTRLLFYTTTIGGIVYGAVILSPILCISLLAFFILRWVTAATVIGRTAKALHEKSSHRFMLPVHEICAPFRTLRLKLELQFKDKHEYSRKQFIWE
jgi:glycosyltransferase involved in cell wall biosynthesis